MQQVSQENSPLYPMDANRAKDNLQGKETFLNSRFFFAKEQNFIPAK